MNSLQITEIKCKYFNSLDGGVEKIELCDELTLHSIAIILGLNSVAEQLQHILY